MVQWLWKSAAMEPKTSTDIHKALVTLYEWHISIEKEMYINLYTYTFKNVYIKSICNKLKGFSIVFLIVANWSSFKSQENVLHCIMLYDSLGLQK